MTSLESIKPGTPKRLTILSQIAVVLFLVWLGYAVGINHMPVKNTIWALTPPIIAISLALITKEVYSSLFLGILTGAMLNADFHPVEGLNQLFPNGIMAVLADKWNVGILVFLVILGTMVQLMNRAGGSAAFGEWASGRIKGRSGAQLSTMLLGCLIFIDDYFNCLTVGSVMRPVTDKHKISRAKLAYLIDSTAAPICIIAPISSWAAAVSGFVKGENGISIFVQSIPFNFYALLTLLMMVFLIFLKVDFGPMLLHENNARQGDLFTTGKSKQTISEGQGQDARRVGRVSDLVIPVVFLIVGCVVGMIYTGGFFAGKSFVDAFAASDASVGLVMGSSVALVMTIAYYLMRQSLSFSECMDCLPEGFKQMVPAMLILAFAWTLKSMTDSLGAATYVGSLMANSADGLMAFLPAIIFVVASHRVPDRRGAQLRHRHQLGHLRDPDPHHPGRVPADGPPGRGVRVRLHGRGGLRRPLLPHLRYHHHVVGRRTVRTLKPRHHSVALCADGCLCVVLDIPCRWLHKECIDITCIRYCGVVLASYGYSPQGKE